MKRFITSERFNKQARLDEAGFGHAGSGWTEDRYYEFTRDEVIKIEDATQAIYDTLHQSIPILIHDGKTMDRMGIPYEFQRLVVESWERRDPSVALRFDLALDTKGEIKLIEVNGDTPTTLVETALIQWYWLVDKFPDLAELDEPGQFNSLHEKLASAWQKIADRIPSDDWMAFSAHSESLEEYVTCEYHRSLATEAGARTGFVDLNPAQGKSQFLYNSIENVFHEPGGEIINYWYKLYPWEWMMQEEFGKELAQLGGTMGIIEPAWKMVVSNKAILSVLYELYPTHPNLVAAFDTKRELNNSSFVEKPVWGREGTGIKLVKDGKTFTTNQDTPDPMKDTVPPVYQALIDVAKVDGHYTQIGSWVVDHQPAGMIIRESYDPIINGSSPIVPHIYR